jgi:VHL beta domain
MRYRRTHSDFASILSPETLPGLLQMASKTAIKAASRISRRVSPLRRGLVAVTAFIALLGAAELAQAQSNFLLPYTPLSALSPLDPNLVLSLKSQNGDAPTFIKFINATKDPVEVNWIDYSGKRVFYNNLAPSASYVQETFVTHPWIIKDLTTGRDIAGFLPTIGEGIAWIAPVGTPVAGADTTVCWEYYCQEPNNPSPFSSTVPVSSSINAGLDANAPASLQFLGAGSQASAYADLSLGRMGLAAFPGTPHAPPQGWTENPVLSIPGVSAGAAAIIGETVTVSSIKGAWTGPIAAHVKFSWTGDTSALVDPNQILNGYIFLSGMDWKVGFPVINGVGPSASYSSPFFDCSLGSPFCFIPNVYPFVFQSYDVEVPLDPNQPTFSFSIATSGNAWNGASVNFSGTGQLWIDLPPGFTFTSASGTLLTLAFAGTPGEADCIGKSVSDLAKHFGGLAAAAAVRGFPSVQAMQNAIKTFCGE